MLYNDYPPPACGREFLEKPNVSFAQSGRPARAIYTLLRFLFFTPHAGMIKGCCAHGARRIAAAIGATKLMESHITPGKYVCIDPTQLRTAVAVFCLI